MRVLAAMVMVACGRPPAVAVDPGDSVKRYASSAPAIERCRAAQRVTAAFLRAEVADGYRQWKAIETKDCRDSGEPWSLYWR